jgi:hypothetical protein
MVHFICRAIHDPAQSIHKVTTEGATSEYLYVKVKPILELETRDFCQALELANQQRDSAGSIPELINASSGDVSTFT